jgi:pimeloyl-ACP methyl ester carboxylesterase
MHSRQLAVSLDPRDGGAFATPAAVQIPGVEEHYVTVNGVEWRYLRAGSGPALVLVHGLMAYSWSWRFNIRDLAQNFTVYAPDLPGCGFSQRADSLPGSLESDADGLISLMDALGVNQFYLLGTSRGGGVAVVLAGLLVQRGLLDRVPRMILSAPINLWSSFGQTRARVFATALGQRFVIHAVPHMPSVLRMYYRKLYGDPSRIAAGSMEGYAAGLLVPRSFHHLVRIMTVWHEDLRHVEATLPLLQQLPILLLWGSKDAAVYPSSAHELQQRLANSATLVMDGVGHLPYEEVPADFNRIVCDFLLLKNPPTPSEVTESNVAHSRGSDGKQPDRDRRQTHSVG